MIERARRIGRTVPLAFIARTWVEVPYIVARLADEFPTVLRVALADNSRGPGEVVRHESLARLLAGVEEYTVPSCLREMDDELHEIDKREPIPDSILHEAQLR
jgi:hypothetical protein